MTIGNRVISLLAEKGLKQKDLANYLGTKPSTVNGWNSENRNPSSDLILRICEFLNVDCQYLLSGISQKDNIFINKEDREWLDLIHNLPPEKRYELKGYAKRMLEESVAAEEPLRQAK